MGINNKVLTDREKAVLYYSIIENCKDWAKLYFMALDVDPEKAKTQLSINSSVSRWKHSEKVNNFLQSAREKLQALHGINNNTTTPTTTQNKYTNQNENLQRDFVSKEPERENQQSKYVDYSNPENQRKKLNQIISQANSSGEALDALKVIISGQKDDRQAAKEQKQIRVYLPLVCYDCPLYEKARKK